MIFQFNNGCVGLSHHYMSRGASVFVSRTYIKSWVTELHNFLFSSIWDSNDDPSPRSVCDHRQWSGSTGHRGPGEDGGSGKRLAHAVPPWGPHPSLVLVRGLFSGVSHQSSTKAGSLSCFGRLGFGKCSVNTHSAGNCEQAPDPSVCDHIFMCFLEALESSPLLVLSWSGKE